LCATALARTAEGELELQRYIWNDKADCPRNENNQLTNDLTTT
jgi:hypothetical protein